MVQGLIGKLMSVLEATLSKLSRYDEGSLIGSILSFTVSSNKTKLSLPSVVFMSTECIGLWKGYGPGLCKFYEELYGTN